MEARIEIGLWTLCVNGFAQPAGAQGAVKAFRIRFNSDDDMRRVF